MDDKIICCCCVACKSFNDCVRDDCLVYIDLEYQQSLCLQEVFALCSYFSLDIFPYVG